MNIQEINTKYKNQPITNIPLRVVYYARVSSEKDMQLNSLINQEQFYENYIKSNPNWTYCGCYVDEGITGISASKRERFNKMIQDGLEGKFDLIVTKEVSRFARNTLDSISYTRELYRGGVAVFFQEDNINTLDTDSELRLTIMSSLAQDESRKTSNRIKFGHRQAIKNGHVLGNNNIYGYRMCNAKYVIHEKEAEMVRLIFELYATGEYGTRTIERILYEKGYRSKKGGKVNRDVIGNIIRNPKYKGYYCGGKVIITDMFTKKQKFLDKDEWIMYKDEKGDTVPAIVSEELWDKANAIFEIASQKVKNRKVNSNGVGTHKNLFTSLIECGNCHCNYRLKYRLIHGEKNKPSWICSDKLTEGADTCNSFYVREEELISILNDVLQNFSVNYDKIISEYLTIYKKACEENNVTLNIEKDLKRLNDEKTKIEKKKEKILELNMDGSLSNLEFKQMNVEFNRTLSEIAIEIENVKSKEKESNSVVDNILLIKDKLKEYSKTKNFEFTYSSIRTLIKKIIITPTGDKEAKISVILNLSNTQFEYNINKKNNKFSLVDTSNTIYTKGNYKYKRMRRGRDNYMYEYTYNVEIGI